MEEPEDVEVGGRPVVEGPATLFDDACKGV